MVKYTKYVVPVFIAIVFYNKVNSLQVSYTICQHFAVTVLLEYLDFSCKT